MGQKAVKKNISSTAKALRKDTRKDYKYASRVNDAIFDNVTTTLKGRGRRLTKSNARILDKMEKLQANMLAAGRKDIAAINRREVKTGTAGGMLSDSYSRSRSTSRATTKAGAKTAAAGVGLGKNIARTGKGLMDILQSGAKETRAAADHATAEALASRNQADTLAIAQMRHELEMAQLQHQQEMKRLRFQADIEEKALKKQSGDENFGAMRKASNALTMAARAVMEKKAQGVTDFNELLSVAVNASGASSDEELGVLRQLVTSLTSDTKEGPDDIASEVVAVLRSNIPGWGSMGKGKRDHWVQWVATRLKAIQLDYESKKTDPENKAKDDNGSGFDISEWLGQHADAPFDNGELTDDKGLSALWGN